MYAILNREGERIPETGIEFTMLQLNYPAVFKRGSERRYLVLFPDFPEAGTDGKDLSETMEEAADCLGSVIGFRIRHKEDVPRPSAPKRGQRLVAVPFWIAGKVALYMAMREQSVGNRELARRLGVTEVVVRRMLNPDHDTKSEKLQAALAVLGKRISAVVEDAA
jgi:antitoxin HicB